MGVLFVLERPSIGRGRTWLLDWALLVCLAAIAVQLIPLGPALRATLSPAAAAAERAVAFSKASEIAAPRPLSLEPDSTGWELASLAGYVALFWCTRSLFSRGGIRRMTRGIAFVGLALTALVAIQHQTSPSLFYWTWRPLAINKVTTYGPFVNRNDFAGWLTMAILLTVGYFMTRARARDRVPVDSTQVWLGGSACLMMGGLLGTLSRGGICGGLAGLAAFVWISRTEATGARRLLAIAAALVAMVAIATMYANLGALAARLNEAEPNVGGRREVWSNTWRMAKAFWLTGVGAGAFDRGMLAYQQGTREFFFNHAHDEYLQVLAEGGVLLAVPAAVALASGAVLIARELRHDHSSLFWVRAGAACGLLAALVHGIWDTGLRIPANAALFAVLAAIALHDRGRRSHLGTPRTVRSR